MMYLRYALFAPLSLIFNISVMLTCPIWAAWAAIFNLDRLPGVFSYVHTHDDDIYGTGMTKVRPTRMKDRWTHAMWWICRNPGYGFDAYVLGFPGEGMVFEKKINNGKDGMNNRFDIMKAANGKRYFSYRRDIRWSETRYLKLWFGWHYQSKDGGKSHMLKFDINPYKKIE